ncbi:cupredoxin domain-containing protein [Marinomonas pollencensis]|uniref:Cupredoxin-like protein n=1 Tax=Marinomonas pollencensis TaxID=491954 RepID=A0A3E0DK54_9GAMM|nr:cupredoxin domain-containing protein [Marinomonas pollencensis]REG82447.1 cupredoxin-like protein [Marinomonas pollencensis]
MFVRCLLLFSIFSLASLPAYAERLALQLQLNNKGFTPKAFSLPPNKAIKIELINNTNKVAELESYDMKFEKIVVPKGKITVFTGPLKAGQYRFFNDYATNVVGIVHVKRP